MNNRPVFNIEEVNKIIRNRRSQFVAQFKENDPVDDGVIKELLENANWAPTHKLTEPWRFVVFSGEGLKKLADYQSNLYKERSKRTGVFKEAVYNKLKENPLKASHVIAIGMKRDLRANLPEMEEISSVAMAVQNMYLTASARGFFGLGEEDMLMGFFFVAKPSSDGWPEGKRSPISDKVTWIK